LKFWALLIMGAVSPFLFSSTLTSSAALVFLLLPALLFLRPGFRIFCLLPAFFLLTTLAINERLSQRWPLSESKTKIELSGVIDSLPETRGDVVRFNFLPDSIEKPLPAKIRVYWYKDRHKPVDEKARVPEVRAGERWRLQLELRSPRGRVNFHGVDAERWYFTDGIGALAYVQSGDNVRLAEPGLFDLQHWRQSVLDKLAEKAADVPSFRMLAALAIADRRALLGSDRAILLATGTGHLLAISGLHIGLAAAMGFYLGRFVILILSVGLKQRLGILLPWLTAWSAALVYSALAGFGVSTQRALIMLTVATVVLLSRRNIHPFHAWLVAMALVLMVDPFAPLRAGFWFSFAAVAVLLMLFVPRYGHMQGWKRMLFAQLGISLLMAPLGMYWFQQASLPGLLANLVAIPVISMLVVPLVLIALLVLWLPGPLAEWLLTAAGFSVHYLFLALEQLSMLQPPLFSSTRAPTLGATILAMLGAGLLLLPRGMPGRYTGVLLLLPMLLPTGHSLADTETRIDFLDVGQGLAVLLTTQDYLMIYDTGPGNGLVGERGWDIVDGTITPMIKAQARSPDMIVASHADLDHAGGLQRLHADYPNALYLASLPVNKAGIRPCLAPDTWMSGKLTFKILHPSRGLPYLGNDSSCVISVNGPGLNLLLSGDISEVVEQRLVETGLQQHDILTAPHHGSSTSSSQVLIDAVKPLWVLISAAMNNRFGFPRADVIDRYTRAHIPTLNTALCGGIRLTSNATGGFKIVSARASRKSIWRWPADVSCPDSGKL
jgi:competence protein ComEC